MTRSMLTTLLTSAGIALAADHKEAPLISEDPSADIGDVYIFPSPSSPDRIVMILTVNPFAAPAVARSANFSPNVRYGFHFETANNGKPEANIFVEFAKATTVGQKYTVTLPNGVSFTGETTLPTVATTPNPPVITQGPMGVTAFAGPRDDPFFFDVVGFNRFLTGSGAFSGADGFAGFNVSAIVIEAPAALVAGGSSSVQGWATTERRRVTLRRGERNQLEVHVGPWEQIERMGNPAVSTALIPSSLKDLFNIAKPSGDVIAFAAPIVASLNAFGTSPANIQTLASVALPDTLKVNFAQPAGFPNGRRPQDDVIDVLLELILNGPVPDGVDANDRAFSPTFPYLADPHQPA